MVELDAVIDNMHTSLFAIAPYIIYLEENYNSLRKLDQIRNMYGKQPSYVRINFEYINAQIYQVLQIIGQFEEQIKCGYDINYFVGMLRLYRDSELISKFYNLIININAKKSAFDFINLYNPGSSNNIKKCDVLISKYTELVNLLSLDLDIVSIPQFKQIPLREAYEIIEMSDQQLEQLYNVLKEQTIQLVKTNNREYFNTIIDNLGRMSYIEKLL